MCERAVGIIRMANSIDKIVIHNVLLMKMRIEKKDCFSNDHQKDGRSFIDGKLKHALKVF